MRRTISSMTLSCRRRFRLRPGLYRTGTLHPGPPLRCPKSFSVLLGVGASRPEVTPRSQHRWQSADTLMLAQKLVRNRTAQRVSRDAQYHRNGCRADQCCGVSSNQKQKPNSRPDQARTSQEEARTTNTTENTVTVDRPSSHSFKHITLAWRSACMLLGPSQSPWRPISKAHDGSTYEHLQI